MKTIKFILQKIVIVEVMLIIIAFASNLFGVSVPIIDDIVSLGLFYLTPIAFIALIGYIILSIISFRIVEIILSIILGGIILCYILNIWFV